MGYRVYSDKDLLNRKKAIAIAGGDTFARTKAMRDARPNEIKCHPLLAIDEDKKRTRECRDSTTHPKSNALAVIFDVTGSMGQVPRDLEASLKDLMGYFLKNNYLPSVAILFGAVGDSTCDRVPLQIGQFEPGAQELMDFFERVFLEGWGGGQNTESYQNALYFMARHSIIDCFEKRGKRGYIFMFGDELPYDQVSVGEIKKLMGGFGPQENIPTEKIIEEVREKYILFYIIPLGTSNGRNPVIWEKWRSLLSKEFVLGMETTKQVCELIGTVVGICEGKINSQEAVENLQKQNFSVDYLNIVKAAFKKLYGINADKADKKEKESEKPDKEKPSSAEDKKSDKKKTLKI